jgi:hypothetical protein
MKLIANRRLLTIARPQDIDFSSGPFGKLNVAFESKSILSGVD